MSIAANKVQGVRAALVDSVRLARLSREHNDANVLCLGADIVSAAEARRIVGVWMKTEFAGGRHARRVRKLERVSRV
jgi:ribose 5-phosphate isomerase B